MPHLFPYLNVSGWLLVEVGLVSLLAGCGHQPRSHVERTNISATVTSGGNPLGGALIDLSNSENGEAYGGTLDAEGRVHLTGVAKGTYTITLQPPPGDPLPDAPAKLPADVWKIPHQFRNPQASPLHASISEDECTFTYDLKDVAFQAKR